mmetsp:Transcript_48720/g.121998  ORF Transcript_48720/g.121998 Transcript_48720/m.121998 type:complete len:90 (-) Transcript_48720:2035-2304(-)
MVRCTHTAVTMSAHSVVDVRRSVERNACWSHVTRTDRHQAVSHRTTHMYGPFFLLPHLHVLHVFQSTDFVSGLFPNTTSKQTDRVIPPR